MLALSRSVPVMANCEASPVPLSGRNTTVKPFIPCELRGRARGETFPIN